MEQHFSGQAWLRGDRETIADLTRSEAARMHATWEQTVAELLQSARAGAESVGR